MSPSDLAADARVLWRLLRGQPDGASHAERLARFYAGQADRYDAFRARLLHGREALIEALDVPVGARVVELGGGTGSNLEILHARRPLASLASVQLVDLCPPLLAQARRRAARLGDGFQVIEADAGDWQPDTPVDRVILSYALTMMPNWSAVLANAEAMLAPGGRIGVVDFHLPGDGWRDRFWQRWFGHDGVCLSDRHLPDLQARFSPLLSEGRRAPVPYLPGLRAPYYLFVGERKATPCTAAATA